MNKQADLRLNPHPRLYIGPGELLRLRRKTQPRWLAPATAWVEGNAAKWVSVPRLIYNTDTHNALLVRAREVQVRILTLLTRWYQTEDASYRDAAMAHVRMIGEWDCWSWVSMRHGKYNPDNYFDLSYGENSATLALAYDLLHDTLAEEERQLFLGIARKWSFACGARHCRPKAAWWFGKPDSNWNTVCAGGLGMLCLAMYEDIPEARALLPRVEESIEPYMRHLEKTSGAWPEGIGYWNYGMYYAFMYLLSRENSTGRKHPLLRMRATRQTLEFPMDFAPNGQPCSFGDGNGWSPLPFHYAVAKRLGCRPVIRGIDAWLRRSPQSMCSPDWAAAAGWLMFHDGRLLARARPGKAAAKLYRGLDWGILADRTNEPELYMSIRGGTTKVPHGHCDLFSFNVCVSGEKMIANEGNAEYLDSTFSPRRYDLPDINAQYKNSIMLNGAGVVHGSSLEPAVIFNRRGVSGIRLVGAETMGCDMDSKPAALFCGRLALLLLGRVFLVVDRVVTPHHGRIEARLHTHARVKTRPDGALLRGKRGALSLAFAGNVPCLLATATTAPTTPTAEPARVLRWCTRKLHTDMVLATLMVPGESAGGVDMERADGTIVLKVRCRQLSAQIRISDELNFLDMRRIRPGVQISGGGMSGRGTTRRR
ncbi:MAG: hypothetical protein C0404_11065 [Verrucomicrobia bacterium]|nr:hypothetical protein [Verrucomicrobiota bacterium]